MDDEIVVSANITYSQGRTFTVSTRNRRTGHTMFVGYFSSHRKANLAADVLRAAQGQPCLYNSAEALRKWAKIEHRTFTEIADSIGGGAYSKQQTDEQVQAFVDSFLNFDNCT